MSGTIRVTAARRSNGSPDPMCELYRDIEPRIRNHVALSIHYQWGAAGKREPGTGDDERAAVASADEGGDALVRSAFGTRISPGVLLPLTTRRLCVKP